jgi:acetyl-CoA carboxylase carboxyl transferase subunit alpha
LYRLGVIDEIVKEPLGGAHRNPQKVAEDLREAIGRHLSDLEKMDLDDLLKLRYEKFRKMGSFIDEGGG